MNYVSTRGEAPTLDFEGVVLAGLADDGGLYLPEVWPRWTHEQLLAWRGRSYEEVAVEVLTPFVAPSLSREELRTLVSAAYADFAVREVAPVRALGGELHLLELFHGPTLAFKDVALQLLGQVFDHLLARRGRRSTVLGATSGDTGSAAIEGCRGREAVRIVILHPEGRTSEVQRRQMTTVLDENVLNLAVQGTFDDAQDLVKSMFRDPAAREQLGLTAVNSINWARVLAQIVYYVTAALALGAPEREVSFAVPTGNFGDVFAGWCARRMGLPIARLVIASNHNDILVRALHTGRYEVTGVTPTLSPSMDIQVSSNFERLLFELSGRDAALVRRQMAALRQEGRFVLEPAQIAGFREAFSAHTVSEAETLAEIARVYAEVGLLLDPHSAVGVAAARREPETRGRPMICLATADAAKFPDAVEAATGLRPALPAALADLLERPERFVVVPATLEAIEAAVRAHAR
jgi:threonine synthase